MSSAESAYVFRHALLRDAAYQLQLPGDRARLHRLAFAVIEELAGGRFPEPPLLDEDSSTNLNPHPTDPFAEDLAEHARLAHVEEAPEGSISPALHALYLRRAATHAERHYRVDDAARFWQKHAELVAGAEKSESLRRAGIVLQHGGRPRDAEAPFEMALEIDRESGNRRRQGVLTANLAILHGALSRFDLAEPEFERALALLPDAGDQSSRGIVLANQAQLFHQTGRLREAERICEQALAIHRVTGNRRVEGTALGSLAGLFRDSGRLERAEETYLAALAIHRAVGNRRSEGIALGNLAVVCRDTGRDPLAEKTYGEALRIQREVGDRSSEGLTLGNLAALHLARGRLDLAEGAFEQALSIHRNLGNRRFEGFVVGELARVHRLFGRLEPARRAYEEALRIHAETCAAPFEASNLCGFALVLLELSLPGKARLHWRKGISIFKSLGDETKVRSHTVEMRDACARAGVRPFDEAPP